MRLRVVMSAMALIATQLVLGAMAHPASAKAKEPGEASSIRVVSKQRDTSRVLRYQVATPSLEKSATTPLRINVILPRGYAKYPDRRYPVLYALPGTSNTADVWLKNLHTVDLTKDLSMIVVVPDGTFDGDGGGFYTNWVDQSTSRGIANWETFHTQELVKWTDQHFRTVADRSARAIVGISQGGFGSMSYAARNPEIYGAAASFSGATSIYYNPVCHAGAVSLMSVIMTGLNGVQPFAPFGDPLTQWANWRAHDPASQVGRLKDTRVDIYTSSGMPGPSDLTDPAMLGTVTLETVLHMSNVCFRQAANAAHLEYSYTSYPQGTHAWNYGDRSLKDYLPKLADFFANGR